MIGDGTAGPDSGGEAAPVRVLLADDQALVRGAFAGTGALAALSERERQVLVLVARGLNNAGIAEALRLSPFTAKTHVSRSMGKLGVRDRAQLVIVAYESGLITPDTADPAGGGAGERADDATGTPRRGPGAG